MQNMNSKALKYTPRSQNIPGTRAHLVKVKAGSSSGKKERKVILAKLSVACVALALVVVRSSFSESFDSDSLVFQKWSYLPVILQATLISTFIGLLLYLLQSVHPYVTFAYNCFLKPFLGGKKFDGSSSEDHQKRLESFYEGQAEVYDFTRQRLLRGRDTLLKLCSAQLRQVFPGGRFNSSNFEVGNFSNFGEKDKSVNDPEQLPSPPLSPSLFKESDLDDSPYCWIDIGGGTGENVERMNEFYPIRNFDRVYVVDITPSLCEQARLRFEVLGWRNVRVICADAENFSIPEEDRDLGLSISLITMSYSLSMMESYYGLVDRLSTLLDLNGIIGVVDFYASTKRSKDPTRQMNWFMRWFWSVWFDLDNVYLNPARREYLEHKFVTVKQLNCRNHFIRPLVRIPYYIWLGARKDSRMPSLALEAERTCCEEQENDEDNNHVPDSATSSMRKSSSMLGIVSDNHVHGQGLRWRQEFDPALLERFKTYIYAFTWEDPAVDLQYMNLGREDHMLVITSGGCNVLDYVINAGPKVIHSVDLNPCQNHMLELKLAGLCGMEYEEFWKLFGEGFLPEFESCLDNKLSPHLSPFAFEFWRQKSSFKNLYKTGCSGLAIRIFQYVIKFKRLQDSVARLCHCQTIVQQIAVWEREVRPHFLSGWLLKVLNNDRFLWGALGVPPAQAQMILEEGCFYEYIANTFDPIIQNVLLSKNYFYYMPLMLRYNQDRKECPSFLQRENFELLKREPERMDAIKIHTKTILSVLRENVADASLTKTVVMDHLDWFSEEDATEEIEALAQKSAVGGSVFYRSAGKFPWYNKIFEASGFTIEPLQIREGETLYIDRVNTYASFWMATKQ